MQYSWRITWWNVLVSLLLLQTNTHQKKLNENNAKSTALRKSLTQHHPTEYQMQMQKKGLKVCNHLILQLATRFNYYLQIENLQTFNKTWGKLDDFPDAEHQKTFKKFSKEKWVRNGDLTTAILKQSSKIRAFYIAIRKMHIVAKQLTRAFVWKFLAKFSLFSAFSAFIACCFTIWLTSNWLVNRTEKRFRTAINRFNTVFAFDAQTLLRHFL